MQEVFDKYRDENNRGNNYVNFRGFAAGRRAAGHDVFRAIPGKRTCGSGHWAGIRRSDGVLVRSVERPHA